MRLRVMPLTGVDCPKAGNGIVLPKCGVRLFSFYESGRSFF